MRSKYLAVLIPVFILLAMTIVPLATILFGETIVLETEPYDPRDIFRGDYVVLNFKINRVDIQKFPVEMKQIEVAEKYQGKQLYFVLSEQGDFYEVDYVALEKPKDRLFLKGKTYNLYAFNNIPDKMSPEIRVNYNLDRYFVPENTGKELEEMSIRGTLAAKVKVWNGYPVLLEVMPKETLE